MNEDSSSPAPAPPLDIQQIMRLLPHRYPFLLIDRVLEVEPRERIVVLKNVSVNEPHFQGHFPDYPLMPGVLMIEAIAQAGGALLLSEFPDRDDKLMVFTGIDGAKFRKPVVPGDQLRIEVKVLAWRSRAVKMHGTATVDGKLACEATVMCQLVPRPGAAPPPATPAPATATPAPATATPTPATATPTPATATPAPATATPELATATTSGSMATSSPASSQLSKPEVLEAASAPLAGDLCQPDPLAESHALPEAAV